jgi:tetratricopeptide (TPR) repeat protein
MKNLLRASCLLFLFVVLVIAPSKIMLAQVTPEAGPMPAKKMDLTPTTNSAEARQLFNEALAATDLNETRKARMLYSKAIEKDPDLGIAYLLRAGTANSTKEYVDDINMGKSKTTNASEWEKLYGDYLSTNFTGDREKQISIAKEMVEKFPSARSYAELGSAYNGNKEFDKAIEAFKKAVELDPAWVGGVGALTNIYMFGERKDLAKAQDNATRLVALAPNSPGAHITLGDAYRAQNQIQKAAGEYQKAIALAPASAEAYYKLGHANLYLGKMEEARKNFKMAGEKDERKTFSEMLAASTYAYEGNSKQTLKHLLDAADMRDKQTSGDMGSLHSEQLEFLNAAATVAVHNGDAATLKTIIPRIAPLSKETMSIVGTPEAMLYHEADMLRWEALLAITEGNYASAMDKIYRMKSVLDPLKDNRKLEGYYYTLGYLKLKQKNYKEAAENLKMADPLSIYNTYLLAKAYEGMGDKMNAQKYYTEVSNYNFNNLDNALIRAEVKKKLAK